MVPDKKSVVHVNGAPADTPAILNVGDTAVNVTVTSPDGSNTQLYKVVFTRKAIPRFIRVSDPQLATCFEDPVSLSVLHRPITVHGTQHSFSASIIDEYTKTSKVNPLTDMPLPTDWRLIDFELDTTISDTPAIMLLAKGVWSDTKKITDLGGVIKMLGCQEVKPSEDVKYDTNCEVNHKLEPKKWEKAMQTIFDESDADKLVKAAEEATEMYLSTLPKPGWNTGRAEKGRNPLDHLQLAIHCYASAIKNKPRDSNLHLKLGYLLEERYLAEDIYGLQPTEADTDCGHAGTDITAEESSKEQECQAICQLRGVGPSASLALQLKAIDEEFHHLKENQQSAKADHVQRLFAWKSKQAMQEGAAACKVSDDETLLGQAYIKYLDALSLDEAKGQHHFQVGRMLVIQGQYDSAVPRLEAALGWMPTLNMAKFYLAFALSLREGGPGPHVEKTINLLQDTMDLVLVKNSTEALSSQDTSWKVKTTLTSDLLRSSNVHLLRGMIQLSKLLKQSPGIKDMMKHTDVLHTAALVAAQVLPTLHRGDTYQQVEWVLLEAHSELLDDLLEVSKDKGALIVQRCQRLSALIKHSTIPRSSELARLQQRTIERLVTIEPCNSQALCMLGDVQLAQYDVGPDSSGGTHLLTDAKRCYMVSIAMEGKPMAGQAPEDLVAQKWWQDKSKAKEEKQVEKNATAVAPAKPAVERGAAIARGRGAPTAGRGAARGAPASRGGAKAPATPAAKGGRGAWPTGRGITPGRAGNTKVLTPTAKIPGGKSIAAVAKPAPVETKDEVPEKPKEEKPANIPVNPNALTNPCSYHPRLGLARAFSREPVNLEECKKYYNEVIDMAPEVHDAYRESAELLSQQDPLGAVDIYAKFPVPEEPSFDDAFIFGEITHLLMKCEKYDDPRLVPNLIKMGQIMGVGYIDKFVRTLEDKFKYAVLRATFAGIHRKSEDDPNMISFFKMKFWN